MSTEINTEARFAAIEDGLDTLAEKWTKFRKEDREWPVRNGMDAGHAEHFSPHHATPKLNTALAQARLLFEYVEKGGDNEHLHSKFARFEDICKAVHPHLANHGLAMSTHTEPGGMYVMQRQLQQRDKSWGNFWVPCSNVRVSTYLLHESGEQRHTTGVMTAEQANPNNLHQAIGIAASYLKRYQWVNLLGLPTFDEHEIDGMDGTEPEVQKTSDLFPTETGR